MTTLPPSTASDVNILRSQLREVHGPIAIICAMSLDECMLALQSGTLPLQIEGNKAYWPQSVGGESSPILAPRFLCRICRERPMRFQIVDAIGEVMAQEPGFCVECKPSQEPFEDEDFETPAWTLVKPAAQAHVESVLGLFDPRRDAVLDAWHMELTEAQTLIDELNITIDEHLEAARAAEQERKWHLAEILRGDAYECSVERQELISLYGGALEREIEIASRIQEMKPTVVAKSNAKPSVPPSAKAVVIKVPTAPIGQKAQIPATDAQLRAIASIGARKFSRSSRDADLLRMTKKPLEQLSKVEASRLIDRLNRLP